MKICFFSIVTFWHGMKGGMEIHGKLLSEGLMQRGHEIIIISTSHPEGKEYEEVNGIRIYYLKSTTFGSPRKGWGRESVKKFRDIISKEKIGLVLSQQTAGFKAAKIAKQMGIPVVTVMHGYEAMVFFSVLNQVINFKNNYVHLIKSFFSFLYYFVFREIPILRNSTAVIAVSNNVARVIAKKPFVNKNKIKVVNNGIDLGLFKISEEERVNTRRDLNISDHEQVILFLSLLTRQKGADIAIKAFSKLAHHENLRLIIAGEGEYSGEAKLLAKNSGIESKVIFTGFIPNNETSHYYNASDLFIFPTLRLESFGIVIAEAMACGKPVIATDIGSIRNVIDDGVNGVLIPPGDFVKLAEQIELLINDRKYSNRLARNAREKAVEKFGLDRMVEDTIKVFEMAIAGAKE